MGLLQTIFGSRNQRILKQYRQILAKVNALEPDMEKLSDQELAGKTQYFRDKLSKKATLETILPEAFAVVREASKRVLGQRHYDVQILGGLALNDGKIAEMSTGEGKTLTATLPCYLNALTGKGVHLVTVNGYLAQRDNDWMGQIYRFLGLTTGVILGDSNQEQRKAAYAADITYGTNNELGFDYLRDNMAPSQDLRVQRGHHFAVVDEVDSILIDEARTPLIISGSIEDSSELYKTIHPLIVSLKPDNKTKPGHFTLNEKDKQVFLTDLGHQLVEEKLTKLGLMKGDASLFSTENINLLHYCQASLRANFMYRKDVDYIVVNQKIVIIDEHTGRAMEGRRWADGLHQAIEAKEKVPIHNENQTLASITFQNYFLLYEKLSGMTGTADTESVELHQIYDLEVVIIPTNRQVIRVDHADVLYLGKEMKYKKIVADIKTSYEKKQPVLVGTTSIENSEYLSSLLKKEKIKHEVLNAKNHEREAHIIAQAGCLGAITIATNMAGRGTDIILGGNSEHQIAQMENPTKAQIEKVIAACRENQQAVTALGGLFVLGTERHESRRIDNQLRGRSGRQGDPGESKFFLSLDDPLMRIFATDMTASVMQKVGMREDEPLTHAWFNKVIERAQRKVEGHHYDIRKQLLQYDNIANEQRKLIYEQRDELMQTNDVSDVIIDQAETVFKEMVEEACPIDQPIERWSVSDLVEQLKRDFKFDLDIAGWVKSGQTPQEISKKLYVHFMQHHQARVEKTGEEMLRELERNILLRVLDEQWKNNLAMMDHLRQGIHFRGYAQKNPVQEYKREAFELFQKLLKIIKYDVIAKLAVIKLVEEVPQPQKVPESVVNFSHSSQGNEEPVKKVGRNQNCPCGSGKKYKHCHGKI